MLTLVLVPLGESTDPTEQVVKLEIITKAEDFVGFFDQLEVWRSTSTASGPWTEITAETWRQARMPPSGGDAPLVAVTGAQAALVGKTLKFLVGGLNSVVITFTGTDPLTRAAAATQITDGSSGLLNSYVDSNGNLVVQTTAPGTAAVLELVDGTAAGDLGLTLGSKAYGKDARLSLSENTEIYEFFDQRGLNTNYYRIRFRNRLQGTTSAFSQAFGQASGTNVPPSELVVGMVDLVDLEGKPLAFREIRLHTNFSGQVLDGKAMTGGDLVLKTDKNGHLEVPILRGQTIVVGIAGTDIARSITTPTDPTITRFNLLDPSLSTDDVFKVRVPQLIYAERRSL